MLMSTTRIALVQQKSSHDKEANVRKGLLAVETAASNGAQIVAFAELAFERFYPQYPAGPDVKELAEPIPGPTTEAFSELARKLGVVVVLNLFELDGTKTFDSSPVINTDGDDAGRDPDDSYHRVRLLSRTGVLHAGRQRNPDL